MSEAIGIRAGRSVGATGWAPARASQRLRVHRMVGTFGRACLVLLLLSACVCVTARHSAAEVVEEWTGTSFSSPRAVSANSSDGSCWVANRGANEVIKLAQDGTELWRGASFNLPFDVSANAGDGSCWVADRGNNQVAHLASNGAQLWRGGGFAQPSSVSVNSTDGSCWVADTDNNAVVHLSSAGAELWRGGGFNRPLALSADSSDGSVWVADRLNNQVVHLAADGTQLWRGGGFNSPSSVSANVADGSCWVADRGNNQIVHLAGDGTELWRGGGFSGPWDVGVDPRSGSCWVSDTTNGRAVLLAENGAELWRGGTFTSAYALAVDEGDGTCWIADYTGNRVTHLAAQFGLSVAGSNGSIEVDTIPQSLPWSNVYPNGTDVVLEAFADSTYEFTGWSGDLSGSVNPTTVSVVGDMSITANFSKIQYALSLSGVGDGTVLVNGVERSLPWSGLFDAETSVELQAVSGSCSTFASWSGDMTGATNPKTITMTGPKSIAANFTALEYTLRVTGAGSGSVRVDGTLHARPWQGIFACGSTVTLEAVPDSCWELMNWAGDVSSTDNPIDVVIDGDKDIQANFGQISYTVSIAGVGEGSVLVDGASHALPWSGSVTCGSSLALEAVPAACSEFASWSGALSGTSNPDTLVVDGNKSVTATFQKIHYTLSLTGDAGGSVTVDGVSHALPWSHSYDCGTTVSLAAGPDSCHEFSGWSGDLTGSASPADVTMDGDKTVNAAFSMLSYTVSISGDGDGQISVDGVVQALPWSDTYTCGSSIELAATPASCWQFDGWSGDLSGVESPVSLTVDGDKTISANFSQIEYTLSLAGDGGSVLVNGTSQALPWSGAFACSESVTIEAVPDEHKEFVGWSGDLSGGENPATISMDADKSITAAFDLVSHTLSVSATGSGTVSIDGTPQTLPWSGSFPYGTEVTLEAAAAEGWRLTSWNGAASGSEPSVAVTVTGDLTVGVIFTEIVVFSDVDESFWAYDAINACIDAGIVFGYPEGVYLPDLKVTRCAMAVFIARALAGGDGNVPAGPAEATFADVPTDHWAYDAVEYAAAANVVTGYAGGNYEPSWVVTRAQMAVFVARSIVDPTGDEGLADYVPPATPTFSDVGTDYWCYQHIEYLAGSGIVSGFGDGLYRPTAEVTRDQMAVYIARAFGLM